MSGIKEREKYGDLPSTVSKQITTPYMCAVRLTARHKQNNELPCILRIVDRLRSRPTVHSVYRQCSITLRAQLTSKLKKKKKNAPIGFAALRKRSLLAKREIKVTDHATRTKTADRISLNETAERYCVPF